MIQKKKELHNVLIADLKPYAKNPRKNDGAVEALAESLKQYGLVKLQDGSFMRIKIEDKKSARVPELAQEEMIIRTHNKMDTNIYEGFSMNYFNQRKDEESEGIEHPTMKPLRLIQMALKNSSAPGDICLDLFGGSGSTLIQCERMGRYCRMIELDPKYCQVIINRWEKITEQKAEKIQE